MREVTDRLLVADPSHRRGMVRIGVSQQVNINLMPSLPMAGLIWVYWPAVCGCSENKAQFITLCALETEQFQLSHRA
jgi:hypothetical protein